MSFKDKYDKAERVTDELLDRVRQSRYSAAIIAVVTLIVAFLVIIF